MAGLSPTGTLAIDGTQLEYRFTGPQPDVAPTLVLLHEGLGSAALWGDFPDKLAAATGAGIESRTRPATARAPEDTGRPANEAPPPPPPSLSPPD